MTDTTDIAALREALCKLKSVEGLRTLAAESIDQLEAERQRADKAEARVAEFEQVWPTGTPLRLVLDENIWLKAKVANPVVLPARFKPGVSKFDLFNGSPVMKLDATGGWLNRTAIIAALNSAGFTVKGE